MNKRFSLHKIENEFECPFDEAGYSRFKFGDTYYAKSFAKDLFDGFIKEFGEEILTQNEIILFPSPYNAIPTASNFLCAYFKEHLNYFLFENHRSGCVEGKIHRKQTYVQDYGNMSFEERITLISNDTYYIDKSFVDGKFCIFIDDIKITGSHEKTVDRILKEYDVNGEFIFVYFAELINKNIHPKIENHYNYYQIKTAQDLVEVINSEHFSFNTRITKFILLMEDSDFEQIHQNVSEKKLGEMLHWAISNNYHQVEEYKQNINKLKDKIQWQLTYKKGQRQNINAPKFTIGLGWDANNSSTGGSFDLDASVFVLGENKKIVSDEFFVFYNNLQTPDKSVTHTGDNLTGDGDGDDEQIKIDLTGIDSRVKEIIVVVTIHEADSRNQNFGQVRNSFIRVFNTETNEEILKYELDEDFSIETAVEFGRIYERNGEWKFEAVGNGQRDGLAKYLSLYQ